MLRFLRNPTEEPADDATLLERFQAQDDQDALALLFDRYLELIYGLCIQYLQSSTKAEDAVMAIYTELQAKVPQHEIRNFKNWLFTFVRNHCLMQLRREKKNLTVSFDPTFMHSEENWHPVSEETEESARSPYLKDCLKGLSEQQLACIQLFYYEGLTYKEIAEDRDEPLGQVRSNIQNGRRNLKNCIEQKEQAESD